MHTSARKSKPSRTTNRCKVTPEKLLVELDQLGWQSRLTDQTLERITALSLRGDSYALAAIATELAIDNQPITLRGLFYRVVSVGYFPGTEAKYYQKFGNLMSRLRRERLIPYSWIVDNIGDDQAVIVVWIRRLL